MPGQRRKDKRMVGFYATEEEALAMMLAAKSRGMTLSDWLRSLIPAKPPVSKSPTKKPSAKRG